jgi:hypothetical protein
MPKAHEAAQRALKLDDSLAEAHCALAFINMTSHDGAPKPSTLR